MNNIKPILFVVPLIALILVIVLFTVLLNKADSKKVFKRFVLKTWLIAIFLNTVWEVTQMPLYKNAPFTIGHIAFCALASIADAIMVLLIYFGFALIYRKPLWIKEASILRIFFLVLVGGIGAIISEMRHVLAGDWAYDLAMPIIPIVNVGLSPVLQFMLLPACIYFLSYSVKGYSTNEKFNY